MFRRHIYRLSLPLVAGLLILAFACGGGDDGEEAAPASGDTASLKRTYEAPPQLTVDRLRNYNAIIQMDEGGEILVELWASFGLAYVGSLIKSVNNFIFLAREGFYDGTTFHKVLPGDYVQGGDPTGTGTSGPGYTIDNEFNIDYRHDQEGRLAYYNTGNTDGRGTNGSQFIITLRAIPEFDGFKPDLMKKDCGPGKTCYPAFGTVVQGMDVVLGIQEGDVIRTISIVER